MRIPIHNSGLDEGCPFGGSALLSRYRVGEKLGVGGMGVVYRAEDVTLKREVALKFMSAARLSQQQTRLRFFREAQTAASLNHPNVCTVYEIGEVSHGEEHALGPGEPLDAGTPFISMELIEGRTLETIVRQSGSLPFDDLVAIALQIAAGMSAAHARGIVHRDLKPGNVMVTNDGLVKILDFGLAKPLESAEPRDADVTATAIGREELTREGHVIGTAAYMSPEQAKGEPVDSRSDVFSFGVMLYELTTGTRPFRGTTTLSTLAKIIEAEPEPIPDTRKEVPQEVRRIIRRCLQKKPEDRYNDTRDLVAALRALRRETTSGATRTEMGPAPRISLSRLLWPLAAAGILVIVAVVAVLAWRFGGRRPITVPPAYRQITHTGTAIDPVVSPDGQFVAYVEAGGSGDAQLMVQDLAGGAPLMILSSPIIHTAVWSPKGTEVFALVDTENGAQSYLIPRLGGTPRRFSTPLSYAAWSPDGKRIAGARNASHEITIAAVSTDEEKKLPIDASYAWFWDIDWSPNGELFAFATEDEKGRYAIWTMPADGGPPHRIIENSLLFSPRFSPRGDALYFLSGQLGITTTNLSRVRIDPRSGRRSGEPVVILSGLEVAPLFWPSFTISRDGKRLSYARNTTRANLWLAEPDGTAGGGFRTTQLTRGTSLDVAPSFSPDGRSVTFVRERNVFVLRLDGGAPEQLTFGNALHLCPSWSSDGREIAYISHQGGASRVGKISSSGGDARLFARTRAGEQLAWAPGKKILYQEAGNRNFVLLDPSTEQEWPLAREGSPGWLFNPSFAPDGKRVAMFWNRPATPGRETHGSWVFSLDGSAPLPVGGGSLYERPLGWSTDGAWVYLVQSQKQTRSGTLIDPVIGRAPARGGLAVEILRVPFREIGSFGRIGDVTRDGRRFVFSVPDSRSDVWLVEDFDPDVR